MIKVDKLLNFVEVPKFQFGEKKDFCFFLFNLEICRSKGDCVVISRRFAIV